MSPSADDFKTELENFFRDGEKFGLSYIDIKSGELHRRVGGYPGHNHRMPVCCQVMKNNMQEGDEILQEPPSGKGATLIIRYRLPR